MSSCASGSQRPPPSRSAAGAARGQRGGRRAGRGRASERRSTATGGQAFLERSLVRLDICRRLVVVAAGTNNPLSPSAPCCQTLRSLLALFPQPPVTAGSRPTTPTFLSCRRRLSDPAFNSARPWILPSSSSRSSPWHSYSTGVRSSPYSLHTVGTTSEPSLSPLVLRLHPSVRGRQPKPA